MLPEYQRDARDRLARRVKTVRKAVEKLRQQAAGADRSAGLSRQAELLQEHLASVRPGDEALELGDVTIPLDPVKTPGQNLSALFEAVKKARRAQATLGEQVTEAERELQSMTDDLAQLRAGAALPLGTVQSILKRHRLPLARPETGEKGQGAAQSLPYRTYQWRPEGAPDAKPIPILVGKGAADSDELCKQAKSNDYWVHAVGTTGSHVIIPARHLGGGSPDLALLRAAAILALHHSKLREDHRGEVYFSRRQHIRKRKGMAPGLWSIDKAETLYFRYDAAELQRVLELAAP